jgi:hypothetical protein
MGYGYAETFLIVFLTHPGVILPTTSSVVSQVASALPAEVASVVPSGGFPPVLSGLWQTMWVWILSLPGQRGPAFGWTMYALYLIFLLVYMYYFVTARLQRGV